MKCHHHDFYQINFSTEAFLNVTHTPTENEFADFIAVDPFMDNFIASLDILLVSFEPLLVRANYQV